MCVCACAFVCVCVLQHYQRIHGTKSYSCHKCGKRFSLKDAHGRHVTECGMDFTCETCRDVFKSRNALYKHARRKGHALPEGSKPKTRKQPPPTNTSNPVLPPRPIIIKQVIRLRNLVSSSTQTHPEDMEQRELTPPTVQPTTSSQISSQTESSFEPSFDFMDLATQTESSFDLMDLATQTDSPFEPSFDLIDLATQTLSTQTKSSFDLIDLATQTEPTFEPSFDLMDLATQTLSTQTEPTFEPSFDLMNLATQTNSGYFDNGTQTTQHAVSYSQSCQTTTTQDCQTGLTTPPSASELTEQGIPSQTVHTHSLDSQDFGTQTTLFD